MIKSLVYIHSSEPKGDLPFDRFLPLDPPGMTSRWLHINITPGSTILDPMGTSPRAALEAAAAGYRVLVACNNPVIAFQLRVMARAPKSEDLNQVIRQLGDLKKGEERLETSIRNLYSTRCASCGADIQASGYLWNRGEPLPHTRIYTCPRCHDEGVHPITDEDAQRLQQIQRSELLHRSRALARVLGGEVDDRESVEQAISIYPVRALYVLFTLINKLEGMHLPQDKRELADAVILSLLDDGNAIWAWPEERERPRQLSIPTQYLEKNLWLEIDRAIAAWSTTTEAVPLTIWPKQTEAAGVCLYPGRMRDLTQAAEGTRIDSILCVFPRPSQAFWSLCSLWASWLWGREKAGGFSQVIERRRFDWYWHTTALHAALLPAAALAGEGIPMFGILPEPAAGLVSSVIQSASISGFDFAGVAVKNASEPIQMEWRTGTRNRDYLPVNVQRLARDAIRELLNEIGEPTEYIEVHSAAMCALADANAFPPSIQQLTFEKSSETQSILNTLLADQNFLIRMDATAQDPESGLWWLAEPESTRTPLADSLENEIYTWLQEAGQISSNELHEKAYQRFPGYLTPPEDLIRQCLESYAILEPATGIWSLKNHDQAAYRQQNINEIQKIVNGLAEEFNVLEQGGAPITWQRRAGTDAPIYQFFITSTAIIARDALTGNPENCQTIFLLPGSRAGLLKFKIDRDPYLRQQLGPNFHFVKFRTLRSIAARADLTLEIFKVLIDSDPLSLEETTQLSMFR